MPSGCGFEGCEGTPQARGLCPAHYQQRRKGIPLRPLRRWTDGTTCAVCGEQSGRVSGYRKYCSPSCENKSRRYRGEVPLSGICDVCGDVIVFGPRQGLRSIPIGTRKFPGKHRRQQSYAMTVTDLVERDGSECALCNEPVDMSLKWPDRWAPTRDHIVPVVHGGDNSAANLQLAHFTCNARKGARVVA